MRELVPGVKITEKQYRWFLGDTIDKECILCVEGRSRREATDYLFACDTCRLTTKSTPFGCSSVADMIAGYPVDNNAFRHTQEFKDYLRTLPKVKS